MIAKDSGKKASEVEERRLYVDDLKKVFEQEAGTLGM